MSRDYRAEFLRHLMEAQSRANLRNEELYLEVELEAEVEEDDDSDDGDSDYDVDEDDDAVEVLADIPQVTSPRVSTPIVSQEGSHAVDNAVEDTQLKEKGKIGSQESESSEDCNRSDVDGLFCPICMEAWTDSGDHQICCLPCGHIFGLSCIKKWIQQRRGSSKCPHCNKKCTVKEVRVLYASRLVAVDEKLQKKIRSLEAKCLYLGKKTVDFGKKEVEWQKREADLQLQIQRFQEKSKYVEELLAEEQKRFSGTFSSGGQQILGNKLSSICARRFSTDFSLRKEFRVEGARCFDVDTSHHIVIIAQRLSGLGGKHVLTKMSLNSPKESENIQIPENTKAVKDLHVDTERRFALLASLGKKLSVISLASNNTVISYDLPSSAWSCSWDINNPQYLYAGLQDGRLVAFDMRQTRCPLESISGLTRNPIHTVYSLPPDPASFYGSTTLLTASSIGLCEWNFGNTDKTPFLVPESENQGVCISLACCPKISDIVATFRPKFETSNELNYSQQSLTPSTHDTWNGVKGQHVLFQRLGARNYRKLGSSSADVDAARMAKSAIIYRESQYPLFASGDESTQALVLQDLPSLARFQSLESRKHPIWDLKYTRTENYSLLGCLTTDVLQIYS